MLKDFYHLKRDNNPHREEAFTLSCLGKLYPASCEDFLRCRGYLSGLLDEALSERYIAANPSSGRSDSIDPFCCKATSKSNMDDEILIIGLTESGIIPSLLMYIEAMRRDLNTHLLYSTRRPLSGISFKENHSHGPDHILPLPDCTIREIWIVEDEITSGNTVCNLMVQLCDHLNISRVRVFAFADFRDSQQRLEFSLKTAINNIECTVHTLNHIQNPTRHNSDKTDKSQTEKSDISQTSMKKRHSHEKDPLKKEHVPEKYMLKNWHLAENRPALAMKSGDFVDSSIWKLPHEFSCGTILTIGESVDLAACFAIANEKILFQQISLSPWQVDHKSIFSRISFAGKYYLYNYERLKEAAFQPVFILGDPIDKKIEREAVKKLGEHGVDVKPFYHLLPAEKSTIRFKKMGSQIKNGKAQIEKRAIHTYGIESYEI